MIYSRIWFFKKMGKIYVQFKFIVTFLTPDILSLIFVDLPEHKYLWTKFSSSYCQRLYRSFGEYYRIGLRHVVMHTYIFRVRNDFLPSRKERNIQFSYHLLSKVYLAIGTFDVWKNVNSFLCSQTLRFGTLHRDFIILTWRMFQSLENNKKYS